MALLERIKRGAKKFLGIGEAGAGTLGKISPDIEAATRAFEERSLEPLRRRGEEIEAKLSPEYLRAHPEEALVISPGALVAKTAPVIRKGIQAGAQKVGEALERERGFIISAKKVIPQAEKIAGQYIPRSTDELSIKASNLIREDIKAAERLALGKTDENAVATASELLKHYAQKASEASDEAVKNAIYDQAADVANTVAKNLTDAGRTVQAASILGRLTPEGQIRFAAKEIQKFNLANPGKQIPELSGIQVKEIENEMRAIALMEEGEAKAIRFQQLQKRITSLIPSKWWQKATSVWKAGLLTGVKTSGLNIFSNVSHAGVEIAKDVPAAAIDSLLSLFTGKRTLTATLRGVPSGLKEGTQKGWTYFKTGYESRDVATKLDYHQVNFKNKAVQKYVDTVFRVLGTEDQPFYYGALKHSLYSQAGAAAKNQGLSGIKREAFINNLIKNPTDEMTFYAVNDAETAVFQNRTALGRVGGAIQKVPGGEFIVPFTRTPSAVAMQIINYSPVGPIKEVLTQISKGRFDQRTFSQAVGRAVVGTGTLYIGGELFKNSLITLDNPKTERERELWKAEGRKANSIKIDNEWRSVQTLGPAGPVLLMGAHFQNALEKSGSPTEAMIAALFGAAKSFTEQTFLKGINVLMGALTDPERSGEYAVSSYISSFIPTIISDVARSVDPKERRPETIFQRSQARIPVFRQQLEPQVTILGEERERVGNPLEVLIDPSRPSPAISNPVTDELRRITNAGFAVSPTLLGDKEGYKGLTQKQNTELWKYSGQIINQKLTSLFSKQEYLRLPDDKKAELIEKVINQSKVNARAAFVLELTEGLEGKELKNKLSELKNSKLMTKEVFKKYRELGPEFDLSTLPKSSTEEESILNRLIPLLQGAGRALGE